MKANKSVTEKILSELNRIDFWDIDIQKIGHALSRGLNSTRYAVLSYRGKKAVIEHSRGLSKKTISQKIKNANELLIFNFADGNFAHKIFVLVKNKHKISKMQHRDIQNLLSIMAKALSMRQISKDRIIETQIINQLNLNLITILDANKIIENLERAARKMLGTENILIFYLMNDRAIGSCKTVKISDIPRSVFNQLFHTRQIFTIRKKNPFLSKKIISSNSGQKTTFIPFMIKNKVRGFFVLFDDIVRTKRNFAITRLKFLANQAALAIERIDLFRTLNRTLRESQGLQELTKIMLSTLDLSSLFNEILQRAQKFLGFERILFSLYDPQSKCFRRITGVGISAKKLKEAKSVSPPFEIISELFHNRYRISNSYYIPAKDAVEIGKKVLKYELYKSSPSKQRIGMLWDPGDIFISPIYSKDREPVALLSLDKPISNLIPSTQKVKLLEAFGDFLGMAIENAQLFEKIEKLSNTDEMTGVYNYRFLREKIASLIKENVTPITLVMIDLDSFKEYNDQFGHLYGDEILGIFSEILVNVVDKRGYVIRYGGDEFIVLLPSISLKICKKLINKTSGFLSTHKIIKGEAPISFSYGIAVYPDNGSNLGDLIDCADKLLYEAKAEKYNEVK